MTTVTEVIDTFFDLLQRERTAGYTPKERQIYNIFLDGLDLDDKLSLHAKKANYIKTFSKIHEHIDFSRPNVLVDAGCGIGHQAIIFSLLGIQNIVAVDLCQERLELAEKRRIFFQKEFNLTLQIQFLNDDIFRILSTLHPDIVFCKDSISHIHPLETFVHNVSQLMRSGGLFIIEEPNLYHPKIMYHVMRQYYRETGKFHFYMTEVINPATGIRVLQAEERMIPMHTMQKMLRLNNLICVNRSRCGGWLVPKSRISSLYRRNPLKAMRLLQILERAVERIPICNIFFGAYLLIGKKAILPVHQ